MRQAKRALVTGASSGIGLELAKLLAGAGYDLALVARNPERLEGAADSLRSNYGVEAETIAVDLAQAGAAGAVFEWLGECDVLVNNAGFANNGPFAQLRASDLRDEVMLDVVALTELTRFYLPGMIERAAGKILNVASTAAFVPGPNMAVYYAAKAYVLSFSEALAEENRETGVIVTCLCPGATATRFQARAGMERSTLLTRLPLSSAEKVARAGFDGMMRGKRVVIPGFGNKLVAVAPRFSPRRLVVALSRKAVEKS